jgi:acyl carrier protein
LEEIERIITKHDEIKETLVLLKGDRDENRYLCAYIVPANNNADPPSHTVLREHVSQSLPDYMVPSYFMPIDKIPLTPNGKIDRKVLPNPEISAGEEYIAPRNELEEKLVEIWAEVLEVDKELIGVNSNFFEIGGNSLSIIKVNTMIKEHFNYNLSIAVMFRVPTINALVKYMTEDDAKIEKSEVMAEKSVNLKNATIELLNQIN